MIIEFACPNGHKLKAPAERAGRVGKCPKCGADFVVPTPPAEEEPIEEFAVEDSPPPPGDWPGLSGLPGPADLEHAAASGLDDSFSLPSGGAAEPIEKPSNDTPIAEKPPVANPPAIGSAPVGPAAAKGAPAKPADKTGERTGEKPADKSVDKPGPATSAELASGDKPVADQGSAEKTAGAPLSKPSAEPMITFLCPKGHKLNSPASLQGRAGKCPHCGERFRVPLLEELEADEEEEIEEFSLEEPEEFGEEPFGGDHDDLADGEVLDIPEDLVEDEDVPPHPTRRLFERLWREREHGGKVILHLAEGGKIDADFYARRWSRGDHGVFASRDEKGNYRIAAIAWSAICRVDVDELVNLPDDVFE